MYYAQANIFSIFFKSVLLNYLGCVTHTARQRGDLVKRVLKLGFICGSYPYVQEI
jgi:hypothetical protein